MSSEWLRRRLHESFMPVPWRPALLRMTADAILLNVSIWLALVTWVLIYAYVFRFGRMDYIRGLFHAFLRGYWLLWTVTSLAVYWLNGFYTRTRGYLGPHKAWIVFRAISSAVILFIALDYFVYRSPLLPRSVAVVGWLFALVTVGGSRMLKQIVLVKYRVEPIVHTVSRKPDRVLVVGGAGYVGSLIVPELLRRGYKVRVLDSFLFGAESLKAVRDHSRCETLTGDVRDIEAVVGAMRDCQAVIHLAAIVGDPACDENRPLAAEINRAATQMLIDVARGYHISRFLFASTCSVYGASEYVVDENTAPRPLSIYAKTKLDSEGLLLQANSSDFHPTILRLGTLFGLSPRPRFDLMVNLLTARAAASGEITLFNGEQWRPFLHVADAARAFVTIVESPLNAVSGEVFNVGDESLNLRLSDVAARIKAVVPQVEVRHVENDADRRSYRASFDKVFQHLGFQGERTIEGGIREIYQAIRRSEIPNFNDARYNNQVVTRAFVQTAGAQRSSMRSLSSLARVD